jgi:hypothetical protein
MMPAADRVTRLDNFSPIGRLFALGSSFNFTKVGQIFRPLISTDIVMYYVIITKKLVGLHFGRYFRKLIRSPWPQTSNRLGYTLGDFFRKLIWSPWPQTSKGSSRRHSSTAFLHHRSMQLFRSKSRMQR